MLDTFERLTKVAKTNVTINMTGECRFPRLSRVSGKLFNALINFISFIPTLISSLGAVNVNNLVDDTIFKRLHIVQNINWFFMRKL